MSDPVATVFDPRTGWRGWSDGLEVGQVWRCKQDGRSVTITHLVTGWVWLESVRKTRHRRSTFKQRYEQVSE